MPNVESSRTRRRVNSFEPFWATSAASLVYSTVIRSLSAAHRTIPFAYGTLNVARACEFSRDMMNSCGVFASIPNASCRARTMVGERDRPCVTLMFFHLGKIKVWDLVAALDPRSQSSLCIRTLTEHTGRVFRLQFDEFQIVSSSHDDTILCFNFLNDATTTAETPPPPPSISLAS